MPLKLYYHPLSSYCHKVLIALYENGTPFTTKHLVNLGDPKERADLVALWPIGKFPVIRDEASGRIIPESSPIIEYLSRHYPGPVALIPQDVELAWQVRAQDRLFDLYVHNEVQKVVGDRLRPADKKDPHGVEQARARISTCYDMFEREIGAKTWAVGDAFTMADCAAAPALFYANRVQPFEASHPNLKAYLGRLMERPSYKRVLEEAEPYFHMFPQ
ncbi:MAG: glutathione S-transferase family protein [Xanthobacteraceae bacterium]|nr:glutathione S-transferase family protein [Xanthobacteraceae bacterium]